VEDVFYQGQPLPRPVLDIGCGDGHFASVAFDRPLDVGVDPSAVVREAAARGGYRLVVRADGARLPLTSGFFASAMSNSVLEHIPQLDSVLREVSRVVRPGSPFIFCVPNPKYLSFLSIARWLEALNLARAASAYREWFRRMTRVEHLEPESSWRARLDAAGFVLERSWEYFSVGALRTLEWGHLGGLPSLAAHMLTGRWILAPTRANLAITERLVARYFDEGLPEAGAFTFYVARRQ
jgi:SAM-dependent methyltransferase